ncbi:GIY-YIG nuclease family protein [Pseudooceanicola sp. CBS1P-1]|uniref:DUF4357 domain-containing protein n=1 Tax=Pseudooceanicola albus TaxID=2692189 RepID=A0A6L7G2C5_9RHOB|nr:MULTISPECIES: GIY-YIG nuclease family protein [Pseudooceanicola]MBT9384523.1 GIY-YIG nuclease family protein [Pseudooceanicola endophyticus]MXN18225.1 DUF4357 domain-containing protein [Pseudooceanicola albus]
MPKGRSVRLFLAEGTPTGVVTAEIVNWTGHVISAPRSKLDVAIALPELQRTGVYMLLGNSLDSDLPSIYVGESDDISRRLREHEKSADKMFWDRFVAVTNKDMNLTKAHVLFLEGKLIAVAKAAKKAHVTNQQTAEFDRLPRADISDMEAFLEEIQLVLPVIGIDLLRRAAAPVVLKSDLHRPDDEAANGAAPTFLLRHERKGIDARAMELDGEFVLLAGTFGDMAEAISFGERLRSLRAQLLESGRAEQTGAGSFRLLEDVALSSPSAASVLLFGTSRNGRADWIHKESGMTYGEWKAAQVDQAVP